MDKEQTNKRGGYRKGSGRPKGNSKLYAFRAGEELAHYIDSHGNKTEFIKDCICRTREEEFAAGSESYGKYFPLDHIGKVIPAMGMRPLVLPFFDVKVVAGFPIPLNNDERAQDIELLRMLCPNPEASYLIRVQGDSMIEAGIYNGDIIIVDKSNRNPSEKEVAVCELNGEYTIKKVIVKDGKGWLIPANPQYPEIEVTPDDDFNVWGTVSYVIHKPRI